jgi:putative ABC transport system permease protein
MYLPLANILHHKLRSAFSALGIGIGICMLVALSGLSRGSLFEIADRWESVDADLLVLPRGWADDTVVRSGVGLSEKYAPAIREEFPEKVARAVPVFLTPMRIANQSHQAMGIEPEDFALLSGRRPLLEGRLPDAEGNFRRWLKRQYTASPGEAGVVDPLEITSEQLAEQGGLEMVIDERLAEAGDFSLGDTVRAANHDWRIVGIAPAGVVTRVFLPLSTAQHLFGTGGMNNCTLIFLKLHDGADVGPTTERLRRVFPLDYIPLSAYRAKLVEQFSLMFTFVDAVNAIALIIAFLFVMTTLYTMVLQRTREIAILKSCGATRGFILRQVLGESALLTLLGTAVGIGLSYLTGWLVRLKFPLLTMDITPQWIGIAVLAAAAGATLASLYPAWRAMRVDMIEALAYE